MKTLLLNSDEQESLLTSLNNDARRLWKLAETATFLGHHRRAYQIRDKWESKMTLIAKIESI